MGNSYSNLVFRPKEKSYDADFPGLLWIDHEEKGRKIPAVFYECERFSKSKKNSPNVHTILYSGGISDDLGQTQNFAKKLCKELQVNVMCYEYHGYGLNKGNPSEKHCYEDIRAAYNYLICEMGIHSDSIILMGRSLGTGPTLELASSLYQEYARDNSHSRKKGSSSDNSFFKSLPGLKEAALFNGLGGVILLSAMKSVLRIKKKKKIQGIMTDMFENIKKIRFVKCKVLLIHGSDDEVVPFKHSEKLANEIRDTNLYQLVSLPNAGHENTVSTFQEEVLSSIHSFLSSISPSNAFLDSENFENLNSKASYSKFSSRISTEYSHSSFSSLSSDLMISCAARAKRGTIYGKQGFPIVARNSPPVAERSILSEISQSRLISPKRNFSFEDDKANTRKRQKIVDDKENVDNVYDLALKNLDKYSKETDFENEPTFSLELQTENLSW